MKRGIIVKKVTNTERLEAERLERERRNEITILHIYMDRYPEKVQEKLRKRERAKS